jgi:MFS family permease
MAPARQKSPGRRRLYYGWIIVAVVGLGSFSQTAQNLESWGVFLKPMTDEFGWSRTVFAGAMSLGTLLGAGLALGIGPVLDRSGPRWSVVIAFFFIGATMLLMAGISHLWQFYLLLVLGRVLHIGIIGIALSVIIPKWFVAQRGRAVAIGSLGQRLGNAVTPLVAQALVGIASWRVGVAAVGGMVWAISLLPCALFLRRRPEDLGLLPDGITPENSAQGSGNAGDRFVPGAGAEVSLTPRQVLRLPSFYLITLAFSLAIAINTTLSLHLMPFLTDRQISSTVAVSTVALSSFSGAPGALVFGFMAERVTSRRTILIGQVLVALSFVLLLLVRSPVEALAWGVLYGVAQSAAVNLFQVIYADYFGRDSLGAVRSMVTPFQSVIQALGPVAAALAYDTTGSYNLVLILFSALTLASIVCVFLARPPAHPARVTMT